MELVIDPHQHGGGLLPGGAGAGVESAVPGAAHDAQVIGQGDIPRADADVGKGAFLRPQGHGQGGVPQRAHQHHGHLLPGDGLLGAEAALVEAEGVVGEGGLHGGEVPGACGHVGEGGGLGPFRLPAEKAHQGRDEGGAGDGLPQAEAAPAHALEEPQLPGAADALSGPVVFGHVAVPPRGESRGGGPCEQGQGEKKGQYSCFHHVLPRFKNGTGPILTDFCPFVKWGMGAAFG